MIYSILIKKYIHLFITLNFINVDVTKNVDNYKYQIICNKQYVLFCFSLKSNDFVAVAGTNSRTKGGTEYKIDKIIIHPKSTEKPQVNDIALLRTVEKITFTEKVKAIKLPTRATKEGATALLAGWGYVDVSIGLMHSQISNAK